ncbi:MAG: ABC transporter substrate-binding protein [Acidimicrobiales bacterium]
MKVRPKSSAWSGASPRLFAGIVIGALLLAGCGTSTSVKPASSNAAVPVNFAVSGDLGAQALIAQNLHYFTSRHLIVHTQNYSLGTGTLDAVLTGRADFGAGIAFAAMTRIASGQLAVVATIMRPSPGFYGLAVRKNITSPAKLQGQSIGIVNGTDQQYATIRYLEANKVPLSSVQLVNFPDLFGLVAALHTGQINAAWVWSTGIAQALKIPTVTILTHNNAGSLEPGYLVVSRAFLAKHYSTVKAVLAALVQANTWMTRNMRQASGIVAKDISAPQTVTYQEMKLENYTVGWNASDASQFRAVAKFMLQFKIIKSTPSITSDVVLGPLRSVAPGQVQG